MNIYCGTCKKEMEIEKDLGSEIHVFSCGCDEAAAQLAALKAKVEHDSEMLAQDGVLIMECMRLLGMDISGAATTDIPPAIERLTARLQAAEGVEKHWRSIQESTRTPDDYADELAAALQVEAKP